jgi:hypothetical protein
MYPFSTIRRLTAERDAARGAALYAQQNYTTLRTAHDRLQWLLAEAHFRNPKTGRLGKKGQTFD